MNSYYDDNADEFIGRTVGAEVGVFRDAFLEWVPAGGRVLDAGCGSGRDSRAFLDGGFEVVAFDASEAMVRFASELTGLGVVRCGFMDFRSEELFDGVWACASLLHVAEGRLPATLGHLASLLKPGGVLYASFKLGDGEREHDGRRFTDLTGVGFEGLLERVDGLRLVRTWITDDSRSDAQWRWLNTLSVAGPRAGGGETI